MTTDWLAVAAELNAQHLATPLNPTYPTATALAQYEAGERLDVLSKRAPCDAPRCGACGCLAPAHDPSCEDAR